jgi:hypothetical protein
VDLVFYFSNIQKSLFFYKRKIKNYFKAEIDELIQNPAAASKTPSSVVDRV